MKISFLLHNGYGIGGTIRTTFNLAGALAGRHDVEIVSVLRHREQPHLTLDPRVRMRTLVDLLTEQDDPRHGRPSRVFPSGDTRRAQYSELTDERIAAALGSLDADVVILSACDTASQASTAATQQAGLATGGDVALDGLVRAFVGAGGRLVIASHWPIPDDYNATERLMTGLFSAPPGTPTVTALRMSERQLMDDIKTSHPFYWSAFAAVGDGEIPLIRSNQRIAAK